MCRAGFDKLGLYQALSAEIFLFNKLVPFR